MQSLWMVFAAVCFAFASLTIKFASDFASASQALTFRGAVAFVCIAAWCLTLRQPLATQHPKLHLSRSLSGVSSLALFTYAVMALPLATGVTLNYTSPVWLALLTVGMALWHGKKLPRTAMLACIAASMFGVALLLKPIFAAGQWFEASMGLLSGILSAVAYWQIKSLGATGEPTTRIVFYHSLTAVIMGGVWWAFTPAALDMRAVPWLLANGVLAMAGQIAMTRAYSAGKTLFASNLMYLTVVFSAFLGAWFNLDSLDTMSYLGIAIIVACSVAATVLSIEKRA